MTNGEGEMPLLQSQLTRQRQPTTAAPFWVESDQERQERQGRQGRQKKMPFNYVCEESLDVVGRRK